MTPPKGRLEAKLAKLRDAREDDAVTRCDVVRRALRDSSNYLVARAAEMAADAGDAELVPDLLGAYDGYFGPDAAERDPQVWGKTAIARALRTLGHRHPAAFVRGLHHVQLEPVWGRHEDMAPNLRCVCAQALVDTDLVAPDALRELIPLLVDPFVVVRVEAINAIAQVGGEEAALLLRLKAHAGDAEAEVVGACFAAIVEREPAAAVAFVVPFLEHVDDAVKGEAAATLAQSRDAAALVAIREFLARPVSRELREATITACAACPQPAIVDLLIDVIGGQRGDAEIAIAAIAQSRFRDAARARTWDAVLATRGRGLMLIFEDAFGPQP